jgi:uncharacterized cupin superfamily protein
MKESIKFGSGSVALSPAPINPDWILEGNPVARCHFLSSNRDGSFSVIWDCSAGRFNWFYGLDETVYIIEGSVTLKDENGTVRRASAGETVHFPKGSKAEWTVEKYIRKVAFCTNSQPLARRVLGRAWRMAKRLAGAGRGEPAPAMFGARLDQA